jgi:hypothetical protein
MIISQKNLIFLSASSTIYKKILKFKINKFKNLFFFVKNF